MKMIEKRMITGANEKRNAQTIYILDEASKFLKENDKYAYKAEELIKNLQDRLLITTGKESIDRALCCTHLFGERGIEVDTNYSKDKLFYYDEELKIRTQKLKKAERLYKHIFQDPESLGKLKKIIECTE